MNKVAQRRRQTRLARYFQTERGAPCENPFSAYKRRWPPLLLLTLSLSLIIYTPFLENVLYHILTPSLVHHSATSWGNNLSFSEHSLLVCLALVLLAYILFRIMGITLPGILKVFLILTSLAAIIHFSVPIARLVTPVLQDFSGTTARYPLAIGERDVIVALHWIAATVAILLVSISLSGQKGRWKTLLLTVAGVMMLLHAPSVETSLHKTFLTTSAYSVDQPGIVGSFNAPMHTAHPMSWLGIALSFYFVGRLFDITFPGFLRALLLLATAFLALIWSDTIVEMIGSALDIIYPPHMQILGAISKESLVLALQWLIVGVAGLGGLLLIFAIVWPIPSDKTVDLWLKQAVDRLWRDSLRKLRIQEQDIVTEQNKRLKLVYPSFELLDREPSPNSRLTGWRKFRRVLYQSLEAWRWPGEHLYDEELEVGCEAWKYHEGRDHSLRFSEYTIIFVHLTEEFMGYYTCNYNFLRDTVLSESFGHHFYEDVVAVWKEDETNRKKLLQGTEILKFQVFKIWLRGSENIEHEAPAILLVKRKPLERFFRKSGKYDVIETEMDVIVKNLSIMLDNKKQRGAEISAASR